MANPQVEDGYTRFAHSLLEALSRTDFTSQEFRIILAVARKTYGFNKKKDKISYQQLKDITGIRRRRISAIIAGLKKQKVLSVTVDKDRSPLIIGINKNYDRWKVQNRKKAVNVYSDSSVIGGKDTSVIADKDYNRKKEKKEIKSPAEPVSLPSIEEIKYVAEPKIREFLKKVCDDLYYEKIFSKAHIFVNKSLKEKKNPSAILYTVSRCLTQGRMGKFQNDKQPWGYCVQILKVENGNYNEAEHQKSH